MRGKRKHAGRGAAVFAAVLGCTAAAAATAPDAPSLYARPHVRFDPLADPRWTVPEADLKRLLAYRDAAPGPHHVCLLGYRWPDGHEFVSTHWREGRLIVRWYGPGSWDETALAWYIHKGVDLVTGVVEGDDTGGSTFLETRRNVEAGIADCEREGRVVVIEHVAPDASTSGDD